MNITILNTFAGNIKSIQNFFDRNFRHSIHVKTYENIKSNDDDILIIPGVGNFGHIGKHIFNYDNGERIKLFAKSGKRIIGICLGAQFLTESSEEAPNKKGLGLIKGNCKSLNKHPEYRGRVPRVGWSGLKSNQYRNYSLYFVHSYYIDVEENNYDVKVDYCIDGVTAMIEKNNILAMQFHPEKSHDSGLAIVRNFLERNV